MYTEQGEDAVVDYLRYHYGTLDSLSADIDELYTRKTSTEPYNAYSILISLSREAFVAHIFEVRFTLSSNSPNWLLDFKRAYEHFILEDLISDSICKLPDLGQELTELLSLIEVNHDR